MAKAKPKLRTEVVTVTPAMAEKMLKDVIEYNRPISKRTIDKYARLMGEDKWKVTGEALLVTDQGKIFNGQHRLHAVTVARVPVDMTITYGIPHDKAVFEAMDGGISRTPADFIGGEGQYTRPYATAIQAACRLFWYYRKGDMSSQTKKGIGSQEVLDIYREHPEIAKNVNDYFRSIKHYGAIIPISWAAFLLYVFRKKDKALAEKFMDRLITGTSLNSPTNSILQLRDILIKDKTNTLKMSKLDKLKLLITAWNIFRGSKRNVVLVIPKEFPKIK